ncbi:DUF2165 family protein [Cognatishimia sp. D5M38]|uniref:DUF2165 family protein n=1 Tax=Cognatishimia coralii TaxID=3083254 RepID=A0ABU8QKG8_9RHOB
MIDFATFLTLCQALAVSFLAAWLTIGVYENIRHPDINRVFTSEVLDLARLREVYPEVYADVQHRRIANKRVQHGLFYLIVSAELLATVLLWTGAISLFLGTETAPVFALLGVMSFTTIWAGFLIAGNWFCYWFCHEGAQNTHYQMLLWGLATLIFLVVGQGA